MDYEEFEETYYEEIEDLFRTKILFTQDYYYNLDPEKREELIIENSDVWDECVQEQINNTSDYYD